MNIDVHDLHDVHENDSPELLNSFNNQYVNGSFQCLWWNQDGAPPHRIVQVSEFLTEFFQHRIIAFNHPIEWPPRSPDITPCDYSLWGYLKNKVYVSAPTNMDDLMQRLMHWNETCYL